MITCMLCYIVRFPLQDFPWIVADEQEVHMQEPRLIPLKTMTSDIVKVSRNITLIHRFVCTKTTCHRIVLKSPCLFLLIFDSSLSFTDAALCGGESPENVGPHDAESRAKSIYI